MSDHTILIVDDEQSVLDSLERLLELDFLVLKCLSGEEALVALSKNKHIPVIITDMRMPKMDGLQFIEKAREVAPQAYYIMLTGNQDIKTISEAVNKGRIFRFLVKPAEYDQLVEAIHEAINKYSYAEAENEFVQSTVTSSLALLGDVLKNGDAQVSVVVARLVRLWDVLRQQLKGEKRWESVLAGRLAYIGLTTLQQAYKNSLLEPSIPWDSRAFQAFKQLFAASSQVVSHIPRIDAVKKLLEIAANSKGKIDNITDGEIPLDQNNLGNLLAIAACYTLASRKADCNAIEVVKELFPDMPTHIISTLEKARGICIPTTQDSEPYPLNQLIADMVLAEDVITRTGRQVLARGDTLTTKLLEIMKDMPELPDTFLVSM
ncbi:MAG: response regulator [Planctomycetales bacterium]|nr:response regulator [Planctomycetales bacterium]